MTDFFHICLMSDAPYDARGPAIDVCQEREDLTLWVENSEYGTQVNFCPFCGYEAKVKLAKEEK